MKPPHTNLRFQISQPKRTLRRRLSQRDFISQLPPELLSSIARHVVDDADNSELAFPLAGISRRWRAVLLGDRTLWGTLILNGKDDRRKVDAFLANGELTTLNYRSRGQQLLGALEGLEGQGGALRRLVFFLSGERESTDHHHLSKLWSTLFDASGSAPLPLRRLQIYSYGATDNPVDLPASSLVNLQTLDVRAGTLVLRSANPFPNLRTLSLTLQSLQTSSSSSPASSPPTHLTFPSLQHLTIGRVYTNTFESYEGIPLHLPNLKTLDLQSAILSYIPFLFPPLSPSTTNASHLRYLTLPWHHNIDETLFISHLPSLPSLKALRLGGGFVSNKLAEALTLHDDGSDVLCPLLHGLDLARSAIEVGSIRTMMESRRGRGLERVRVDQKGVKEIGRELERVNPDRHGGEQGWFWNRVWESK